ncbi:hypothetical protein L3Q72_16190 [Vibrio sp. JC009]|uniref:hypothetical protein n=1 Tax=Vibrio sp. JC009 TaxID=2912314 RepID=UPI0023B1AC3B|nr:hypothetical protein [Vibrio sp. JC009]WED24417.1 hypothetical protein L3Q72_16190 [Vibrio sp. JC009]
MSTQTKTMNIPLALVEKVQILIDAYEAKEKFNAERKAVVENLLKLDAIEREMTVYSLKQSELLDTLKYVYELSGVNNKFVKNILTKSRENPDKALSDSQRSTAKAMLFDLLNDTSFQSAFNGS